MEPVANEKSVETVLQDLSERLHPPHKRDLSFYLVLFVAVLPIWSVVPLSWAFVVYALRTGKIWTFAWQGRTFFAAALCEVFFSVHYLVLAWSISGPSPLALHNLGDLHTAFRRILRAGLAALPSKNDHSDSEGSAILDDSITPLDYHDPRAVDFRNYMRTWFGKVPWSTIRRQELYAWLYWSIFNARFTSFEEVPKLHQEALLESVSLIERRSGSVIPDGSNPAVKPLLLTLDPVRVRCRPLVWYAGVSLSNHIIRYFLANRGVRFGSFEGLDYMLYMPSDWDSQSGPQPIVFLHGLGLGLTQYQRFTSELLERLPDHPILVPLQPHISQQIFHPLYLQPMSRRVMTECLAGLMEELGWVSRRASAARTEEGRQATGDAPDDLGSKQTSPGVTLISHSNGSFAHAWMLKVHPEMVDRSCFVDPVTFCSWEGDLCYNFLYRPCSTGLDLIVKYFVGTELGVVNVLQRHFDWYSNSLWYEEIPNALDPTKTMFFLGGKDAIVNAERVKRYLVSNGVSQGLWFEPEARHGQILLRGSRGHRAIFNWLRNHEVLADAPPLK